MNAGPVLTPVVDRGLGNSAYLVDLGDGRAMAVDPSRDLRALLTEARRRDLHVAYAVDTHLHADFLSGARQLAAAGARIVASRAESRRFPHIALGDGEELDLGGLTLRALGTPGHTPGHLAYLLLDGPRPLGVFTGGSLIVGGAARTDLVDPGATEELARAQYASLQRLLTLGDDVGVWPTHGAGSFCSSPGHAERVTTIGRERQTNPLLAVPDEDTFVQRLTESLGSYPRYFGRLAEANRRGPSVFRDPPRLPPLDPAAVAALLDQGAVAVDVRPVARFAAGHVPGALSVPLRAAFATWLGWLVDPSQPVVVVRDDDQDPDDILWPAVTVGIEDLAGELAGGISAWVSSGRPLRRVPVVPPSRVAGRVLDVRQDSEFAGGHLPGAQHVELGSLPDSLDEVPAGPLAVMCAHGERAMTAASLLARAGRTDLEVVAGGGPPEWAHATGRALDRVG